MKILGQEIKMGQSVQLKMDIAKLHTQTTIEIPVIVSRGKKAGPTLLLIAGIHGDEVNGVEIVRQIIAKKFHKPETGTVICIPLVNVFGFLNQNREFPDGRDLNRVFPGSKTGSLASRFAYHLIQEIIPHIDYCIDFHTGGAQRFNVPHLRIAHDDETLALAKIFNTKFIQFTPQRDKTFRETMVRLGKKVLLFEGGKSLNLTKSVSQTGVRGVLKVMTHLNMRNFESDILQYPQAEIPIIIKKSKWLRAKHSGMFRSHVKVGQFVLQGEILGSISDPFGSFEKMVKNMTPGYILNANHSPIMNQGDALFHIGFE
jgi:uncharacterized protein